MSQVLHVTVHHDTNHTVVAVRGRVYADTIDPLRTALTPLLDTDRPRIVLDLSEVEVCDSSGLNLIVGTDYAATREGGWLRVVGLQPIVRRVVSATNLDRLLSIHATVDDAVRPTRHSDDSTPTQQHRRSHPTLDQ